METSDQYQQTNGQCTRAINIEELKKSDLLTGLARLKRLKSEKPEQVSLTFASGEDSKPSSVFLKQAEEKRAAIHWERFSNLNMIVNTVAYVQWALKKHKPATSSQHRRVSTEEREKAKAVIFKLQQQRQFDEQIQSLKAETEIPKAAKIYTSLDEEGLIRATGRIDKS